LIFALVAESVALAVFCALAITVTRALRGIIHELHRKNDLLTNQLLHAMGRTWQPPPQESEPEEPDRLQLVEPDQEFYP